MTIAICFAVYLLILRVVVGALHINDLERDE
jgi:hypothetical protein